jgi:hypothetical protein
MKTRLARRINGLAPPINASRPRGSTEAIATTAAAGALARRMASHIVNPHVSLAFLITLGLTSSACSSDSSPGVSATAGDSGAADSGAISQTAADSATGDSGGMPTDGGSRADAGSEGDGGVSSGGDAGTGCGTMAGAWDVTGMCGSDYCQVDQTGCALHILCNEDIDYQGTVMGASFTYSGTDSSGYVHTCTGTIQGTSLSGSCSVTNSGSCAFSATPHP